MDALVSTGEQTRQQGWTFGKIPLIAYLLVGFVLCLSPHAFRYVVHFPDERHYTDAAIEMVQTGDYLTPRTASGDLRLKKPILTYWLIAASYQLFGVSPLASRLPFVLLGAGVVWLTYRLAWYLWKDRNIGLMAGMVVSFQPALMVSSPRSMPDIVLTFFLLISAFGFVRLMREPKADWTSIGMAFAGAGLAIASKGLPAVAFTALACCMFLLFRRDQVFRDWLGYFIGLLALVILGFGWFAIMFFLHGTELLNRFVGDQVTGRVNLNLAKIIGDLARVLIWLAICFIPWWGWLSEVMRNRFRSGDRQIAPRDPTLLLLAVWIGIYLVLAAGVDRVNVRYLAPIIPLVSLLAAGLMAELSLERRRIWCVRLGWSALIGVMIVAMIAAAICVDFGDVVALGIGLAILISIWSVAAGFIFVTRKSWQSVGLCATLSMLLLATVSYVGIYGLSRQTLGERLMTEIESRGISNQTIAFTTKRCVASRLRVVSGGEIQPRWLSHDLLELSDRPNALFHDVLLLKEKDVERIDLSEYDVISVADGFRRIKPGGVLKAAMQGEFAEYVDAHRGCIKLAIRRSAVRQANKPMTPAAPDTF